MNKKVICEKCEDSIDRADAIELPNDPGVYRCTMCMDEDYSACPCCDDYFSNDSGVKTHNGDFVCGECFNQQYHTCSNCSDVFCVADTTVHEDIPYCIDCFNELFGECYECCTIISRENCFFDENDDCYCSSCYAAKLDDLHDYSYTPDFRMYGENKDNLFFGIELEIENKIDSDFLAYVNRDCDILYAKADGSLDNGLEIVSHPMTFEYFNEIFHTVWKPILESKNHGYRSYNTTTCGIHIHISKKAFSTWHLYKFMRFFYVNNDFITKISQRDIEKLDEWATNNHTGTNITRKAKFKKGNTNRYSAINLQPYNTVEIRIFRGTLDESSFRKNIEFLHALYYFTKTAGTSTIDFDGFIVYITKNKKQYKNLHAFLQMA